MELRVAVRGVEAWLMADRQSFASFLGVAMRRIPRDPEQLADPKRAIVDLARESTRRAIRDGLVPSEAVGVESAPAYTDEVIQYVRRRWSPNGRVVRLSVWRGRLSVARRSHGAERGRSQSAVAPLSNHSQAVCTSVPVGDSAGNPSCVNVSSRLRARGNSFPAPASARQMLNIPPAFPSRCLTSQRREATLRTLCRSTTSRSIATST